MSNTLLNIGTILIIIGGIIVGIGIYMMESNKKKIKVNETQSQCQRKAIPKLATFRQNMEAIL